MRLIENKSVELFNLRLDKHWMWIKALKINFSLQNTKARLRWTDFW